VKKVISIFLTLIIAWFLIIALFDGVFEFKQDEDISADGQAYIEKSVVSEATEYTFQSSKNLENGSANMVTSVVVDYRSFDTLGEVTVLFISSFAVAFILGSSEKRIKYAHKPGFILKVGARLMFVVLLMYGAYLFIHGHLTPGGGFPGGAMIGAAFLLRFLGDESYRTRIQVFKLLEGTMGSIYVLLGIAGILSGSWFLENVLDTGTVGELMSAGFIPIVYVLIGLKVGSECINIFNSFLQKEV